MEKRNRYVPLNPVIDNFSHELNSGVLNATKYGKNVGALGKGKSLKVTIRDNAMIPAIRKGDVVTVKSASIDKMNVGDLVYFRKGGTLIVRRVIRSVIRTGETYLTTKADSSSAPEKSVKASQVFGKITRLERNGKNVRVSSYVGIINKITCFGTIPLYRVILRTIVSVIPFVHMKDDV
ncbi:MAG: S24 family peptidase [Candidatus Eremiobacteraeota bacterium]|nr:S24 family peptidase [Candidatus Eremiobacteraeota bacterium]